MSHWSRGVHTSGVRFWNFTASQPAAAAWSISAKALASSPLWLIPISPVMYTGRPGPTSLSPRTRVGPESERGFVLMGRS
jgi:hypothetical protein